MEKPIAVRTVAVFPHEAGQAVQLRLHGLHSVRHEALGGSFFIRLACFLSPYVRVIF